jgi:Uma2 family endonuclease
MSLPLEPTRRYTVEEYLELEGNSPQEKYEYREGLIVNMREALAMAGAAPVHVLIATNVAVALSNRLQGGPCRGYVNDLRVRIPRKALYTYPDTTVVCGKENFDQHPTAGATLTNPRLIVEVLSPSTELYDRGDTFALYREIPSLAEYVLVAQSQPRVETYFRHDGGWAFHPYDGRTSAVKLLSLNIELPMGEIYTGVEFLSGETADAAKGA